MTKELFSEYLVKVVAPWLLRNGLDGPKTILIDGDQSHEINLQTAQWLIAQGIEVYRFPAHLTHLLCPLDVSVFAALKGHYRAILRQKLHRGAVRIGVAERLAAMEKALKRIAPSQVEEGWSKAGLYPLNESKWKEEKWAELSVPFTERPPAPPAPRHSQRRQFAELGHSLLDDAVPIEEKAEYLRNVARDNPGAREIVQAAMPSTPAPRHRGRKENATMARMLSDSAIQAQRERETKRAEEQQAVLHRAKKKETMETIKRLHRTAEEAFARTLADGEPDSPEASSHVDELHTAKRIALEAVRMHEEQGVGAMCARKASMLAKRAEKRLQALQAGRPDAEAGMNDENQDPATLQRQSVKRRKRVGAAAASPAASTSTPSTPRLAGLVSTVMSLWRGPA
jgi:hypothetical protein